jgi:uncharacterized membrane protein YkoI
MRMRTLSLFGVAVLAISLAGQVFAAEEESSEENTKLLQALPNSKHSLKDGITQSSAKSPETAISAKFEFEDGKLSLSVYTAEKGLEVDADDNVLKELAGNPEEAKWTPEVEVFKDVPHVARASQQLTLVSLTKISLLDILAKAEKDVPGTVFSITPVVENRKPCFEVLIASKDKKVHELHYDLFSGNRLQTEHHAEKH